MYEERFDDTIESGIKRLKSLFETYRHKRIKFNAMQRIGDGLSWIVADNKLYIEYIDSIPDQLDVVYKSRLCVNFTRCYFTDMEIEKIIRWFTSAIHMNAVVNWDKGHKQTQTK